MNWVKENRFLTGWIAFVLLGAVVLGYLLMTAMGRHAEHSDSYDQQSQELSRLERLVPYPSAVSLKALAEQHKNFEARVDSLQQMLAKSELPVEPMTPEQFQDRLRAAVTAFTEKAAGLTPAMKLPERFYMGFDRYQTEPPRPEAAGPLGRQLKAIAMVLNQVVEAGVLELRGINRDDLPEEKGDRAKTEPDAAKGPAGKGKGDKGDKSDKERVKKYPFELVIFSSPTALQRLLNSVVTAREQFFIVRNLIVKNEKDKGPARALVGLGVDPAVAAAPGAPAAPAAKAQTFVVGEERIESTLRLEIADFADVPTTTAK